MQPPSTLRPTNQPTSPLLLGLTTNHPLQAKQPATLSDLLGQLAAPYFDFLYLPCILFNYSYDLYNYQLLYFLVVKDYKQACYVKVQSVFFFLCKLNLISDLDKNSVSPVIFSIIPVLILNSKAILVQVLNYLILISITSEEDKEENCYYQPKERYMIKTHQMLHQH